MALEAQGCELKTCYGCKWFARETYVCVNDASDHRADFVMPDEYCSEWEKKKSPQKAIENLERLREEIRTATPELWALADRKVRLMGYIDDAVKLLKEKEYD